MTKSIELEARADAALRDFRAACAASDLAKKEMFRLLAVRDATPRANVVRLIASGLGKLRRMTVEATSAEADAVTNTAWQAAQEAYKSAMQAYILRLEEIAPAQARYNQAERQAKRAEKRRAKRAAGAG